MSFFDSEVVRAEMAEISELQEEVYSNVFKFQNMSSADKKYHIEILERLMEKQEVMYTRLSLSDDSDATLICLAASSLISNICFTINCLYMFDEVFYPIKRIA